MKHILVIDDDVHIGNMLEETLEREGYQVSHACSGTEVLLVLQAEKPDLVLLDRICEDTPDCMENSLKVHVSNLRRKLKEVTGKDYMEAVWGIGFKMREM